jgi:hypothetical protein
VKLTTPEKTDLIVIEKVAPHEGGLLIEGTIMGAMPMKAVLSPAELRRGFRFLSLRTIMTVIRMIFTGRA